MNVRAIAAKIATTAVLAGAATALAAGAASAKPTTTVVDGVTLQNMWMHCNAFGGYYDEGPGWATCVLPSGQLVSCTPAGCIITSVATGSSKNVVVRSGPAQALVRP